MFRRWIVPLLLILAAGAFGAWAIAGRGKGPEPERPGRGKEGEPAPPAAPIPDRGPHFSVLFGGELSGRLWIPPCSQFRQGGLARLGTLVRQMTASARAPMLLDTGDLAGAPGEAGVPEFQAGIAALTDMGLAVTAVGEKDLLLGLDRWRAEKNEHAVGTAVLCANLRDDRGVPLLPAVAHLAAGKKKVLVAAILSPSFEPELRAAGVPVRLSPPVEAVREALSAAGKADYVILLSHSPVEESRALLRAVPALDLVLTAHAGPLPWMEPEVVDGRLLLAPGTGWQFVCAAAYSDQGEGRKPELIDNTNRAVGWSLEPSGPVQFLLDQTLLEVRLPGRGEAVLRSAAAREPAGSPSFTGPEACASCHPAAHAKWREDPHSRSMEKVRAKAFHAVGQCLAYHATAPGRRGGHAAPGDSQAAVACESCHGPGGEHAAQDGRAPLADAKASCARCHVPEMSPGFRFEDAWPKIVHGR